MSTTKKIFKQIFSVPKLRRLFLFATLAGVISSVSYSYISVLIKALFDAFELRDVDTIYRVPWIMFGLFALYGISRYWNMFLNQYVGDKIGVNLRDHQLRQLLKLNLSFHGQFESGSGGLMSRIFNDVTMVQHGIGMIVKFIREPVVIVALFGWLLYLDWKVTLTIIVVIPILAAFLKKISRSLRKYSHRSQEELEHLTNTVKESLDGIRVIQSFNLEKKMERRFQKIADRYIDSRKQLHKRTELTGPVTELISALLFACIFTYFGMRISQDSATIGDLVSYITAMLMIGKPIKELQEAYIRFQHTLVSADRVFELIENQSHVPQIENPKPFPKDWKSIEYKNVSFRYGDEWVLRNFNLVINKGDSIAFVGESGSGKSTAVNLLERFFDPTEGEILVDGTPVTDFSLHELRANIALVTQDVFLFNDSIHFNVWAGDFEKPKENVEPAAKAANAHNFIMEKDQAYETNTGDRGGNLSGGEKQRVSIARAFLKDSPILILDEATSALDSVSEVEVQKGIESLMQGRTVLVIAHRLSTVVKADKILVMKGGQIVESGKHEELVQKQGEYFKYQSLQST